MEEKRRELTRIKRWVLGSALAGPILYMVDQRWLEWFDPDVYLALSLVTVAITTFFGLLRWGIGDQTDGIDAGMRTAIAAAIVATFLVLVSYVAFWQVSSVPGQREPQSQQLQAAEQQLPPLTETMIQSFTAAVTVTLSFYLASEAASEAYVRVRKSSEPEAQ